ncbi:MAG: hypothetical protein LBF09_04840 [Odoribacteraceae bacterium]|nr:hypothetical protein [Odoribacteraceae bacterium]
MGWKYRKTILYCGLFLLLLSFVTRWSGMTGYYSTTLLVAALLLKASFLVIVLRSRGFSLSPAFSRFILPGVVLILVALFFKSSCPLLYKVLFLSAIALKVTGLYLLLFPGKRRER